VASLGTEEGVTRPARPGGLTQEEGIAMPQLDSVDVLTSIADRFGEGRRLTPAERAEVLRIAQGMACKASAAVASVAPETIRARRKRIYRKLGVSGASEVISRLLAQALQDLAGVRPAERRVEEFETRANAMR
jgi:DNA-binding CsgD family transcriptional regulator